MLADLHGKILIRISHHIRAQFVISKLNSFIFMQNTSYTLFTTLISSNGTLFVYSFQFQLNTFKFNFLFFNKKMGGLSACVYKESHTINV